MNGYMAIKEASKKWEIGERRINTFCKESRIEGAEKFGLLWAISEDAEKENKKRKIYQII